MHILFIQLPRIAFSILIGIAVVLSLTGSYLVRFLNQDPIANLDPVLAWVSELNALVGWLRPDVIALGTVGLLLSHLFVLRRGEYLRTAFVQGFAFGSLLPPVIAAAIATVVVVWKIFIFVFGFVLYIFGIILLPVRWIVAALAEILRPVFELLAQPFIWLWNTIILPVLEFVAIPFVWLWESILGPLLTILSAILAPVVRFVLTYIALPLLVVVGSLIALLPFAILGRVMQEAVREAFRASMVPTEVFAYGVGVGFCVLEATASAVFFMLGLAPMNPSFAGLVPIALQLVFLSRAVFADIPKHSVREKFAVWLSNYWHKSGATAIAQIILVPIALWAALHQDS